MEQIRVGCAVLVINKDRLLLGKRGKEPNFGMLIIPGGGVDFLEALSSAAQREIKEETGLDITLERQLKTCELINPPDEHRIIVYWQGKPTGGRLTPSSDLLDAAFYSREEIAVLDTSGSLSPFVKKVLVELGWLVPVAGSAE